MLPEAQNYLQTGGLSAKTASWVTIGTFLGGVLGIQVFSRLLHHYIPSHVVDCDTPHDEGHGHGDGHADHASHRSHHHEHHDNGIASETTPLIVQPDLKLGNGNSAMHGASDRFEAPYTSAPPSRRPTLKGRITTQMSTLVSATKSSCEEDGPCYGYTDPGGRQCVRTASRSPTRKPTKLHARRQSTSQIYPAPLLKANKSFRGHYEDSHSTATDEESQPISPSSTTRRPAKDGQLPETMEPVIPEIEDGRGSIDPDIKGKTLSSDSSSTEISSLAVGEPPHHHHVPENAFLAIGLQTSIAIALHKLPEGFITYATNHANPQLGFAVFIALFIHNLSEGFVMALPLYLAFNNRAKAMFWSSILGGVSQPLGAGVAALWFKIAGTGGMAPDDKVYGCMFSITAGIMASVALQLFSQSLDLTHNRNICTIFAFLGMGILGVSRALTAG